MRTWLILRATLFVLASAVIVYLSRRPLAVPGSHGFYRFFAWEAIVALVVLNRPVWFRAPFSPAQQVCWLLLVGSIYPLVAAVRLFRSVGHADSPAGAGASGPRDDPGDYALRIPHSWCVPESTASSGIRCTRRCCISAGACT